MIKVKPSMDRKCTHNNQERGRARERENRRSWREIRVAETDSRSWPIHGQVDEFAGPDHGKDPIYICVDGQHHIQLCFGLGVILGVAAWMDDSVHVQVEVIVLHTVRVRTHRVWWHLHTIHHCILQTSGAGKRMSTKGTTKNCKQRTTRSCTVVREKEEDEVRLQGYGACACLPLL